jgi:uncharacterized membrane protein
MRYAINGMLVYPMINEKPEYVSGKLIGSHYDIVSKVKPGEYLREYVTNGEIFETEKVALEKLLDKMQSIIRSHQRRIDEINQEAIPA